ncbi:MAG: cation diffusion facilitator family transporter [Aquificaceae bacterium]
MKKEHWALLSLGVNTLQSLAKFIAGVLTGSLSMLGESMHSLSDSFASLIAYFTLRFSDRKFKSFPYGLYKLENIGSILIAMFLLIASYEIFQRAFQRNIVIKDEYLGMGFGVILFSLFSSLGLSFLERRAGKKLKSPVLIADSYHTLTDAFGSSLVLMSLLSYYMGYALDRYFAMGVAVLIAYTGIGILRKEVSVLLDVSADEKTLERIRNVILSFDEVKQIKNLFVRTSGGKLFADITLVIEGRDFSRIHATIDKIEESLKREVPELELTFIHYEPLEYEKVKMGVLLDEKGYVNDEFGNARKLLIFRDGGSAELIHDIPKDEESLAKFLTEESISIVICGHHPESAKAKWILSKGRSFVWETEEKNPYKAFSEVVFNQNLL